MPNGCELELLAVCHVTICQLLGTPSADVMTRVGAHLSDEVRRVYGSTSDPLELTQQGLKAAVTLGWLSSDGNGRYGATMSGFKALLRHLKEENGILFAEVSTLLLSSTVEPGEA